MINSDIPCYELYSVDEKGTDNDYMGRNMDEMDFSDEDKAKYDYKEEHEVYILKSEFAEDFEWNENEEIMILPYEMSFDDLDK